MHSPRSNIRAILADDRTLAALDFPAIRERLAAYAMTDRAAARARALLPGIDRERTELEQAATGEMRVLLAESTFSLPRVPETENAVARAVRGVALSPEDLHAIAVALGAAQAAIRRVQEARTPRLQARCRGAAMLSPLIARIDHAIGDRAEILDRASPTLTRLRKSAVQAHEDARARCQAILRSSAAAKALQDAIVTMRDGRFVVPVKAECVGQIPGIVHDTSSTGQTLFIEPLATLEANNRLRTLRKEEEYEIARILADLSSHVGNAVEGIERNLEILADLDMIAARAHLAQAMRATPPLIADTPCLRVVNGRHPLLGERAVPQSFALDADVRFIIISGPNMGGKTVALKTAGLFIAMAACGMHVPADEGTVIGHFTALRADIGDEQSIEHNASTFSAHLTRLRELLAGADERTLVLIDEIASGTEPASSAALGVALIEEFLARGVRGIVTTHASELKLFAHERAEVRNASVRFDPKTYRPTFELDLGAPGQSLAFPLARAMGLPETVVERAETLLSHNERAYDRALAELTELRAQAAAQRDASAREHEHVLALQENVRRRAEALERERRMFARRAEEQLAQALRDFTAELERRNAERTARARVTAGQSALLDRVVENLHQELGFHPARQTTREQPRVSVGDVVYVETFGGEAVIAEDYGETVLLAMGAMKSVVPKRQVRMLRSGDAVNRRRSGNAGFGGASGGDPSDIEAAAQASVQLDVRGKRYVEAEPLVERWIDEGHRLGLTRLRLIHGKGTGLLARGLHVLLKGHPQVKSMRLGALDEGGSGVTILEL